MPREPQANYRVTCDTANRDCRRLLPNHRRWRWFRPSFCSSALLLLLLVPAFSPLPAALCGLASSSLQGLRGTPLLLPSSSGLGTSLAERLRPFAFLLPRVLTATALRQSGGSSRGAWRTSSGWPHP